MFEWRDDIRNYFDTAPEFEVYRKSNRGEYRVLRCEFPKLMGWSTLQRPPMLPRSLKAPYFSGPYALQSLDKDRIFRPHVNRLKLYKDTDENHMTLRKGNIILNEGLPIYRSYWGELRVGYWKPKDKEILIRMYNKNTPHWKQLEKKMLKEVCHVVETGHPNFLQYYGCLENKFWKYHLFEYMPRGDLLKVLRTNPNYFTEDTIRKIFVQIVYAVSHLHDKDMVHRNLKLENILVGENWEVRIIDITNAEKTTAQNRGTKSNISRTTYSAEYGPKLYRSPERVLGWGFNPLLDQVWGLGVILYAIIFKKFPFKLSGDDENATIEAVENGVKLVKGLSCPEGAKDLLCEIFQWEPHRPRTFELLDHPWLSSYPEVVDMKSNNAIGRYTHERAEEMRNEAARLLNVRKRMFRHFKLFREDRQRQPANQAIEMSTLPGVLSNAQRFIGSRPYGLHEIQENIKDQHVVERLYREEYWPRLYKFNPLKCNYLGINRVYCKPRQYPVMTNLMRLADKDIPSYGLPPPKKLDDEEDSHALELKNFI